MTDVFLNLRKLMVEEQIKNRGIKDERVLNAMLNIPRHLFIPEEYQYLAYENRPVPIGFNQTISQPFIVGFMTEKLELETEHRVLEIGTGCGYQTAILASLVKEVYSIEVNAGLAKQALQNLEALGYKNIKLKTGDGYYGWKEEAPFDRIIIAAASSEIPSPLIDQLANGGKMILPVGKPSSQQELILCVKDENGRVTEKSLLLVSFVPFLHEN